MHQQRIDKNYINNRKNKINNIALRNLQISGHPKIFTPAVYGKDRINRIISYDIKIEKHGFFKLMKRKIVEIACVDNYSVLKITHDFETGKILKEEEVNCYDGTTIPIRPDDEREKYQLAHADE